MIRLTPVVIASAVASLSLLVATYTANPWAVLVTSSLFVFVWFPRWRGKLYRAVLKLIVRVRNARSE